MKLNNLTVKLWATLFGDLEDIIIMDMDGKKNVARKNHMAYIYVSNAGIKFLKI